MLPSFKYKVGNVLVHINTKIGLNNEPLYVQVTGLFSHQNPDMYHDKGYQLLDLHTNVIFGSSIEWVNDNYLLASKMAHVLYGKEEI